MTPLSCRSFPQISPRLAGDNRNDNNDIRNVFSVDTIMKRNPSDTSILPEFPGYSKHPKLPGLSSNLEKSRPLETCTAIIGVVNDNHENNMATRGALSVIGPANSNSISGPSDIAIDQIKHDDDNDFFMGNHASKHTQIKNITNNNAIISTNSGENEGRQEDNISYDHNNNNNNNNIKTISCYGSDMGAKPRDELADDDESEKAITGSGGHKHNSSSSNNPSETQPTSKTRSDTSSFPTRYRSRPLLLGNVTPVSANTNDYYAAVNTKPSNHSCWYKARKPEIKYPYSIVTPVLDLETGSSVPSAVIRGTCFGSSRQKHSDREKIAQVPIHSQLSSAPNKSRSQTNRQRNSTTTVLVSPGDVVPTPHNGRNSTANCTTGSIFLSPSTTSSCQIASHIVTTSHIVSTSLCGHKTFGMPATFSGHKTHGVPASFSGHRPSLTSSSFSGHMNANTSYKSPAKKHNPITSVHDQSHAISNVTSQPVESVIDKIIQRHHRQLEETRQHVLYRSQQLDNRIPNNDQESDQKFHTTDVITPSHLNPNNSLDIGKDFPFPAYNRFQNHSTTSGVQNQSIHPSRDYSQAVERLQNVSCSNASTYSDAIDLMHTVPINDIKMRYNVLIDSNNDTGGIQSKPMERSTYNHVRSVEINSECEHVLGTNVKTDDAVLSVNYKKKGENIYYSNSNDNGYGQVYSGEFGNRDSIMDDQNIDGKNMCSSIQKSSPNQQYFENDPDNHNMNMHIGDINCIHDHQQTENLESPLGNKETGKEISDPHVTAQREASNMNIEEDTDVRNTPASNSILDKDQTVLSDEGEGDFKDATISDQEKVLPHNNVGTCFDKQEAVISQSVKRVSEWIVFRDYKTTGRGGYGDKYNVWTKADAPSITHIPTTTDAHMESTNAPISTELPKFTNTPTLTDVSTFTNIPTSSYNPRESSTHHIPTVTNDVPTSTDNTEINNLRNTLIDSSNKEKPQQTNTIHRTQNSKASIPIRPRHTTTLTNNKNSDNNNNNNNNNNNSSIASGNKNNTFNDKHNHNNTNKTSVHHLRLHTEQDSNNHNHKHQHQSPTYNNSSTSIPSKVYWKITDPVFPRNKSFNPNRFLPNRGSLNDTHQWRPSTRDHDGRVLQWNQEVLPGGRPNSRGNNKSRSIIFKDQGPIHNNGTIPRPIRPRIGSAGLLGSNVNNNSNSQYHGESFSFVQGFRPISRESGSQANQQITMTSSPPIISRPLSQQTTRGRQRYGPMEGSMRNVSQVDMAARVDGGDDLQVLKSLGSWKLDTESKQEMLDYFWSYQVMSRQILGMRCSGYQRTASNENGETDAKNIGMGDKSVTMATSGQGGDRREEQQLDQYDVIRGQGHDDGEGKDGRRSKESYPFNVDVCDVAMATDNHNKRKTHLVVKLPDTACSVGDL